MSKTYGSDNYRPIMKTTLTSEPLNQLDIEHSIERTNSKKHINSINCKKPI